MAQNISDALKKAEFFIEALPYIKKFSEKIIVVKIGGSIIDDQALLLNIIQDVVWMKLIGIHPVIVHGGGQHISNHMERLGKSNEFVQGLRVTDDDTMDVTQMILAGLINKDIVSMIHKEKGKAVGLSGKDGQMLIAKKIAVKEVNYGNVGDIITVDPTLIHYLSEKKFIPVISPIAVDAKGKSLNVNGDTCAVKIAVALLAEKIFFMTDVRGIYGDIENENSFINNIRVGQIDTIMKEKSIHKGMRVKLEAAKQSVQGGIHTAHIISGKLPHALLAEIFTKTGIGTIVTNH